MKHRLLIITFVFILVGCGVRSASLSDRVSSSSLLNKNQPNANRIINYWPLSDSLGFVQTDTGLWFVNSVQGTWNSLSLPNSLKSEAIIGVEPIDSQHIWIVSSTISSSNPWDYTVFFTTDGGLSWATSSLASNMENWLAYPSSNINIEFVDNQYGWVAVRSDMSSNFSQSQLFRTSDGGKNWKIESIPSGGEYLDFVDSNTGWTTNVPAQAVYITHNGGESWKSVDISLSIPDDGRVYYSLPYFNDNIGYLYANVVTSNDNFIVIFKSQDNNGDIWKEVSRISNNDGISVTSILFSDKDWNAFLADGRIISSVDDGLNWQYQPRSIEHFAITQLKYFAKQKVWGTIQSQDCNQPKKDCTQRSDIYESIDGGSTWQPIALYDTVSEYAK